MNFPYAALWMDLEIIIISEVRQGKTISYESTYMWNLEKQIQMNLFTKQTQCLQKTIMFTKG